jgi:hypothetical protein
MEFTDEEYADFFGSPEPLAPKSRRLPVWARFVGLFVAAAMSLGGVLALVDNVRTTPDVREPAEIEAAAWERVAESDYGWLVEDILIRPIDTFRVGAFVTNNPPDGVITIDLRPWRDGRLDELMDHEIGHLLDFAIWAPGAPDRKGGLGTEAWAECAAVDAGIRRTDPRDPGGEYHCFGEELLTYRAALAAISMVCMKWGAEECRSLDE